MWQVELTKKAKKQLSRLPENVRKRILRALEEKLAVDPNFHLSRLSGYEGDFYRFRVGDYRLLCSKLDKKLVVIVIAVGHRKDVYGTTALH